MIEVNELGLSVINVWFEFFLEWMEVIKKWEWMWFVYVYGFGSLFVLLMLYVSFFFYWFCKVIFVR